MKSKETLIERFEKKISITDNCWIWIGAKSPRGYGNFNANSHTVFAHRFSYELYVGPIPKDLTIDHLCRNTSCVNPQHLEAVTQKENIYRGEGLAAKEALQTHCKHGHEFTVENTHIRRNNKGRDCKTCWTVRNNAKASLNFYEVYHA